MFYDYLDQEELEGLSKKILDGGESPVPPPLFCADWKTLLWLGCRTGLSDPPLQAWFLQECSITYVFFYSPPAQVDFQFWILISHIFASPCIEITKENPY